MVPTRCTAGLHHHLRGNDFKIVRTRRPRKHHAGHVGIARVGGRTTGRTESPADDIAAVGGTIVASDVVGYAEHLLGSDEMGGVARAARGAAFDVMGNRWTLEVDDTAAAIGPQGDQATGSGLWTAMPNITKATPTKSLGVGICAKTKAAMIVAVAGSSASSRANEDRGKRDIAS